MIIFIKFQKWKTDEHKKKSILRRISTKSKNFLLNKKKTLTEEDIEEMRERVEQVNFEFFFQFLNTQNRSKDCHVNGALDMTDRFICCNPLFFRFLWHHQQCHPRCEIWIQKMFLKIVHLNPIFYH